MTADSPLKDHRSVWDNKPVLRAIYDDYHRYILGALGEDGPILDIGAGSGHFRQMSDQIVSLDILPAPWVDVAGAAEALPFADGSIAGIAMLDVLHHLPSPMTFFNEAKRVLKPGGRIAMIEPGITPLSWCFFHYLHQEDVDMSVDPTADQPPHVAEDPFASNQGLPTCSSRGPDIGSLLIARTGVDGSRETLTQSVGLSAERRIQGVVFDPRVFGAFDSRRREMRAPHAWAAYGFPASGCSRAL